MSPSWSPPSQSTTICLLDQGTFLEWNVSLQQWPLHLAWLLLSQNRNKIPGCDQVPPSTPGLGLPTAITTSPCGLHPHPLTYQGPPIWRPLPRTVFCLMPAIPSDPRPVVPSKRNPSPQSHPRSHNSSDSVLYLSFATELTTRFNGLFVIA